MFTCAHIPHVCVTHPNTIITHKKLSDHHLILFLDSPVTTASLICIRYQIQGGEGAHVGAHVEASVCGCRAAVCPGQGGGGNSAALSLL